MKLTKEFPNKGWGLQGLNKLLKKLREMAQRQDEVAALEAYGISLVFSFCNIHTQNRYYKKEIYRLIANFLSCIITKY